MKISLCRIFNFVFALLIFYSCNQRKKVDLVIHDATIYSMDQDSGVYSVMVVNEGRIIAIGGRELGLKYNGKENLYLKGKFVYPGFIDAHSHFFGLGQSIITVDLRGVKSEEEMIGRVKKYYADRSVETPNQKNNRTSSIIGRGWDQNLWPDKKYPTNAILNQLFPEIPVCLTRIDGHAALVNQKALEIAGINETSSITGGEFIKDKGKLTGVLIDNAVDLVTNKLPKPTNEERKEAILRAQDTCFKYGLTTVCDAGVDKEIIDLYNEMHQSGELKIRIYAMANPTQPTLNWLLNNGPLKTERLHVQSVKYYMDGAMGSRGACLINDYSDKPGHKGFLLNPIDSLKALALRLYNKKIQLNVHCIGDSANRITLQIMSEVLGDDSTSRWRIEHMQLITDKEFEILEKNKIIPSMQSTHATSDAPWVTERLGKNRMRYAYALKTCMEKVGCIALGTDFPVEEVNPFYTFYTAIMRKHPITKESYNLNIHEQLTKYQAMKAMTIWAAYSQFEEKDKGSLEVGKYADFIVLNEDLFTTDESRIPGLLPSYVYVNGKLVANN